MRLAVKEWLLLGIGILVISVLVFGTMYTAVTGKSNEMNTIITNTNVPD